jgi:hypothetical protein
MSKAIILDKGFEKGKELALPASYAEISSHNLYLCKVLFGFNKSK